ncbi:MAG: hypothetical protein ACRD1R_16700 [Acidobacteriota bacterium]
MSIKRIGNMNLTIMVAILASAFAGCSERGTSAFDETVEIPQGTVLYVQPTQDLSMIQAGDEFIGILSQPLEANGRALAPAGTQVSGEFVQSEGTFGTGADRGGEFGTPTTPVEPGLGEIEPGRTEQDTARETSLWVELHSLHFHGEEYGIETEPVRLGSTAGGALGGQNVLTFRLEDSVDFPVMGAEGETQSTY